MAWVMARSAITHGKDREVALLGHAGLSRTMQRNITVVPPSKVACIVAIRRHVEFQHNPHEPNMETPFKLVLEFGPWSWFFLAIGLFIADTMLPGAFFLWFRLAAIGVGVLALTTGIAWQWQIVVFGVLSVIAAVSLPKYVQRHVVKSDVPHLNARGHQYVGCSLVVAEAIDCGRGKVRAADTLWCAQGADAPVGTSVKVTGVRGTVLLVERATP